MLSIRFGNSWCRYSLTFKIGGRLNLAHFGRIEVRCFFICGRSPPENTLVASNDLTAIDKADLDKKSTFLNRSDRKAAFIYKSL